MEMQNKTIACQNCKQDFVIDERDALYYQKISVPHPTWCPECRLIRRIASFDVWTVYWRNCDKCNKRTLMMYHKDNPVLAYCPECWWADDWDGTEYGVDYDPNRTFFDQMYDLSRKTPWVAQETLAATMVNSEYGNGASWLRNCYLTFFADYCENITHSSLLFQVKDTSDSMRISESELLYGSFGISKSYQTFFCEESDTCTDVWFSRNCYNCTNCVGCVNLRGESYCIFNERYSKEEYAEKVKELGLDSWTKLKELEKKARAFWLTKPYRVYTGNSLNLNVTGEYVFESKNSQDLYLCTSVEDSRYVQFVTVPSAKDCYDYSGWGANVERMYETHSTGEKASNVKFSANCYADTFNDEYCIWAPTSKNCFGCVNLKRKSYCILNKEYSKEEYEKLKNQIIEDMKKNPYIDDKGRVWSYGEFFPLRMNMIAYNESNAMKFFPKTKEEALSQGFAWYDGEQINHDSTLNAADVPDTIAETKEDITKEVIACALCKRGYKVGPLEFTLLKKMNLPIPHECPSCRQNAHFARLNPPRLWQRNCAKCNTPITTAFAPDRPEIVYCESCYQQEMV